mmetsp:Transcript_66633/g.167923  ORF Transcript_66633/g.167923 Transcript_66633/m.167923 type:complete len:202 (+) Transcript_66633:1526-2131(+)
MRRSSRRRSKTFSPRSRSTSAASPTKRPRRPPRAAAASAARALRRRAASGRRAWAPRQMPTWIAGRGRCRRRTTARARTSLRCTCTACTGDESSLRCGPLCAGPTSAAWMSTQSCSTRTPRSSQCSSPSQRSSSVAPWWGTTRLSSPSSARRPMGRVHLPGTPRPTCSPPRAARAGRSSAPRGPWRRPRCPTRTRRRATRP